MIQSIALIHCIHISRKDCKQGETVPFVVAISSSEKSNKPKRIHSRCWALESGGIKRITGLKNNSSSCLCSPDGSRWRPSQDNYLMHQHQLLASQPYNTRGNIFLVVCQNTLYVRTYCMQASASVWGLNIISAGVNNDFMRVMSFCLRSQQDMFSRNVRTPLQKHSSD